MSRSAAVLGWGAAVLVACCGAAVAAGGFADGSPSPPAADSTPPAAPVSRSFDLQAHRGGAGLVTENTLQAFANALELGVASLELDIRLSEDGLPVVTHDRRISAAKCRDTAPAGTGDPEFPYVGDLVRRLTYAQLSTLDCGFERLPDFPRQRIAWAARMPLLGDVFRLADCYGADRVRLSVDPKFAADAPGETASRTELVHVLAREVREAGMAGAVTVHSVDWGVLALMRRVEPRLPIVAASSRRSLEAGRPGRSPWLAGLDVDDYDGDVVAAAAALGADGISPQYAATPGDDGEDSGSEMRAMVARAHAAGLRVLPWTIDDAPTMRLLVDARVDGIVTDYPDRLRAVMSRRGLDPPPPLQTRGDAPRAADPLLQSPAETWTAPFGIEPPCVPPAGGGLPAETIPAAP
jgi:glycerophosphoryl diester phosphodiesterase